MPPSVYTVAERRQFVKWYFQGNSTKKIVHLFGAAYADRPVPRVSTVMKTIMRFETLGCVVPCKECVPIEQQRDNCVMYSCAVRSCTSNSQIDKKNSTGITFHSFPKERKRRNIWIIFVKGGKWVPNTKSRLCSKHFMDKYFSRKSSSVRLKHNAIPTICGPQDSQPTLPLKQEQDNPCIEEREIEMEEHFLSNISKEENEQICNEIKTENIIKEENEQICNQIKTEFVSIKEENDEDS